MKNILKTTAVALAVVAVIASCNSDDITDSKHRFGEIQFTGASSFFDVEASDWSSRVATNVGDSVPGDINSLYFYLYSGHANLNSRTTPYALRRANWNNDELLEGQADTVTVIDMDAANYTYLFHTNGPESNYDVSHNAFYNAKGHLVHDGNTTKQEVIMERHSTKLTFDFGDLSEIPDKYYYFTLEGISDGNDLQRYTNFDVPYKYSPSPNKTWVVQEIYQYPSYHDNKGEFYQYKGPSRYGRNTDIKGFDLKAYDDNGNLMKAWNFPVDMVAENGKEYTFTIDLPGLCTCNCDDSNQIQSFVKWDYTPWDDGGEIVLN